ncbi:MAG: putative membrane protein YdjX (TVP38/TMEM64 family) [Granulosicoccus sp.]|jgi:uncharacterized membrane protein YdjX (TVP38/TMEM64 family)
MLIGRYSSSSPYFSLDGLNTLILDAGVYGVVLFILLYAVGILMNIPGVLYLFIGFVIYGDLLGFFVVYIGSLVAVIVHFFFARFMAGEALAEVKNPFVKKQLDKLCASPIRTILILRVIFYVSPPVNYALALSPLKVRDFIIGSIVSLPVSISLYYVLVMIAKDQWIRWFAS